MPETVWLIVVAAAGVAAALTAVLRVTGRAPRIKPIDSAMIALIVFCVVIGQGLGDARGTPLIGIALGGLAGFVVASVLRNFAVRS